MENKTSAVIPAYMGVDNILNQLNHMPDLKAFLEKICIEEWEKTLKDNLTVTHDQISLTS